jgi:hypothetical protein
MSIEIRHLLTLVEVWGRKEEPGTADLQRALHVARALEDDTSSPTHLKAFAWHLAVESHRAVGWDLPTDVSLASCNAAAVSVAHASSLLSAEIEGQVRGADGPVLVLGALAASRSVFGRWDLLPASGALLVPLAREERGLPSTSEIPATRGIHWATPGRLQMVYEEHAFPVSLNAEKVLVPTVELVAARAASRKLQPGDPETLVFCGAALASVGDDRWDDVTRIAKSLGHGSTPRELAMYLGIDQRLDLGVGRTRRSLLALRNLLRRGSK